MSDYSSALAEFRIFNSVDDFLNNRFEKNGPLAVKKDMVIIPPFKRNYITYIRSKRLETPDDIKDDGSIFIFHDSSAYAQISPQFFNIVMLRKRGIYIKEQSLNIYQDTDRFIVGYHFPHWLSFQYMSPVFAEDRPIDVMYAGKARKQRDKLYYDICQASKQLRLKTCFGQSKKQINVQTGSPPEGLMHPREYVKNMRRSKICYSFLGTGYRSHRDWEALLCGSFMLNDMRSVKCCQFRGLKQGHDFIAIDHGNIKGQMEYWLNNPKERIEIAKNGFDTAWGIWKGCQDQWQPIRKLAAMKIGRNGW